MPKLWTPKQASDELGISVGYVRLLVKEGNLKASRFRTRLFIDPEDEQNRPFIAEMRARNEAVQMTA